MRAKCTLSLGTFSLAFLAMAALAIPAAAADRPGVPEGGMAGGKVELELARWRQPVDPKGDFIAADQLLGTGPSTPETSRLNASSFDLMMIRREWDDSGSGWKK